MSNQLLASKVIIEEEDPNVRAIDNAATSILGIAGVTERGPHERTLVTSTQEYQDIFGGYVSNGYVKQALDGFFANGGSFAWVKRVVHYSDISNESTKTSAAATLNLQTAASAAYAGTTTGTETETFELSPADTLVIETDGGGDETVTFDAAEASVECANAETYALVDLQTLTVKIDQGAVQTIIFNAGEFSDIANAPAEEVAAVINAELSGGSAQATTGGTEVTIYSDTKGTGSYVEVTGGTANTALGFSTSEVQGTGDVSDITAVTAAEALALINADTTGLTASAVGGAVKLTSDTTGASSSVQVKATSTADTIFGFDNATHSGGTGAAVNTLQVDAKTDGEWGNSVSIKVTPPTNGEADKFNLAILISGVTVETWPNLSMTDADDRYVETVINDEDTGSNYITVTDLDAAPPSPADLPAGTASVSGVTTGPMTTGNDGLTGLDDNDFIGSETTERGTGLRGFDDVQDLSLLIVPDRATSAVQNAMITYAEVTRVKQIFCVLDPPASQSATDIITYTGTTASLIGLSEFGAMYWPRVKVLNPNKTVFGSDAQVVVPPSGHIAGVCARNDARQGGVYIPPAGIDNGVLFGVLGFETDEVLREAKRDLVYPKRINPLTTEPGLPRFIDGTRTLKAGGNFPTVAERRGAIFIEQSIKNGIQFARHHNNTEKLRATVTRSVTAFLINQMLDDAFRTRDPDTAFYVDFGPGLNPPSVQFAGKLIGRIGIATNKPVDWPILRFSQDTRAIEEQLAS